MEKLQRAVVVVAVSHYLRNSYFSYFGSKLAIFSWCAMAGTLDAARIFVCFELQAFLKYAIPDCF